MGLGFRGLGILEGCVILRGSGVSHECTILLDGECAYLGVLLGRGVYFGIFCRKTKQFLHRHKPIACNLLPCSDVGITVESTSLSKSL